MASVVFGATRGRGGGGVTRGGTRGGATLGRGLGQGSLAERASAHSLATSAPVRNASNTGYSGATDRALFGTAEQVHSVDPGRVEDRIERGTELPRGAAPQPAGASGNSWYASRQKPCGDDLQRFVRQVSGLLNKLTPEKYESLCAQILSPALGLVTLEAKMEKTIGEIFVRAIDQPTFCAMYSQLCTDVQKAEDASPGGQPRVFRKLLLRTVQSNFEGQGRKEQEAEDADKERKRRLGCTQFVGHLYRSELLTDTVIHTVVQQLLYGKALDQAGDGQEPTATDTEILVTLLQTVGALMDQRAAEAVKKGKPTLESWLKQYYAKIQKLVSNQAFPARIRFMVQGALETRRLGWPERRGASAMKIDDFNREADEIERKKVEGIRQGPGHGGDVCAWGRQAEVGHEFKDIGERAMKEGKRKRRGGGGGDEGWTSVHDTGRGAQKAQERKPKRAQQAGGKSMFDVIAAPAGKKKDGGKKDKGKKGKEPEKGKAKEKKKAKAEKKDRAKEAEEEWEALPDVPTDLDLRTASRVAEWAELQGSARDEHLVAEVGALAADAGSSPALLMQSVARSLGTESGSSRREAYCEVAKSLVARDIVPKAEALRGLGWFLCTATVDQLFGDYPLMYERALELFGVLCPLESQYSDAVTVFTTALRTVRGTLGKREQAEYINDSVGEIFREAWTPLHERLADADLSTEWRQQLLMNLVTLNGKAGWPEVQDEESGEAYPLIAAQASCIMAAGLADAALMLELREQLGDARVAKKRGRHALELLTDFFASCEGGGEEEEEEEDAGADDADDSPESE